MRGSRVESRLRLRFFLSSPGDLPQERKLAQSIIEQTLQKDEFVRDKATCEAIRWDDPTAPVPMPATLTPQEAVDRKLAMPGECDVVVVMLWSRLGTPLPDAERHRRPDGSLYLSGTEWEYENALSARPQPHILVYRCKASFPFDRKNPEEQRLQYDRVEKFFANFRNADGSLRGGFAEYETPQQFGERLLSDLKAFIKDRVDQTAKVVENRSSGRRPSRPRWALMSRGPDSSRLKTEPLVTVPRARLDKLKELEGRLDAYIGGYVICREVADHCTSMASGIEHARSSNRLGDNFFWGGLCDHLRQAREEVEGFPELFKQERAQYIQALVEQLADAEGQLKSARYSKERDPYETAVESSATTLDAMKREVGVGVVHAKRATDALLKEIENIIQRILEWMPPAPEEGQDQPQRQTESFETKLQRRAETAEQKPADLARAQK